ncbi:hypothetical protein CHS0354_014223 [Potamilus streckersoni]|uniref:Uncharacterized protein n=1 Tax=Potamilus streckersoni TaxID=2493646 RepID=A0AAE0W565_9BIVA|nr:hypothetical protein CHS0354_014223 [Potamilus streckersoni]
MKMIVERYHPMLNKRSPCTVAMVVSYLLIRTPLMTIDCVGIIAFTVCYVFLRVHAGSVSHTIQCLSSWASQVVVQPCTTPHRPLTPSLSPSVSSNGIQLSGVSFLSSIKDELGILRDDANQLYEKIVVVLNFSPSTVAYLFGSIASGYPQFWTVNMTSIQLLTKIWKDLTTYFMYVDIVATKEQRQVKELSRPQQESLEGTTNTLLHDLEVTLCYLHSATNIGVDSDFNQPMLLCNILNMDDSDYISTSLRVIRDFKTYINDVISFIGSAEDLYSMMI